MEGDPLRLKANLTDWPDNSSDEEWQRIAAKTAIEYDNDDGYDSHKEETIEEIKTSCPVIIYFYLFYPAKIQIFDTKFHLQDEIKYFVLILKILSLKSIY